MIEKILGLFTNYPDKTGKDLRAENLNEITFKINALIDMILPMFKKLGLISDWVIEHGSNTNGSWEKWHSGKLVCRHKLSKSSGLPTLWASNIYLFGVGTWTFPVPSLTTPYVSGSNSKGYGWFVVDIVQLNRATGVSWATPASTNMAIDMELVMYGTWK